MERGGAFSKTWRTTHGDVTDEEWELITWSWLMNHRRLQVDYERDPRVAEGFIWAAHARLLLRRLTDPQIIQRAA